MPIDLLLGIVTGMCYIYHQTYLTLVLDMLEARNEVPSVDFSFSFFLFFGMCFLRRLFTLLKGQVGKVPSNGGFL